ncbi:MAG: hypothetical protein QW803_12200 [Candidatus Methanomethylicia archaeon]
MKIEENILEALKKGKMVIVKGVCESKVKIECPKDKIEIIVRS